MAGARLKLVQPADVVGVPVRRDGDQRLVDELGHRRAQWRDAHPGIDEHIGVAAAHVPGVAAPDVVHVRLGEHRDAVIEAGNCEPAFCDPHDAPARRCDDGTANLTPAPVSLPIYKDEAAA